MADYYAFNVAATTSSLFLFMTYNIYAYYSSIRLICFSSDNHSDNKKTEEMSQIQRNYATSYMWLLKHAEKNDAANVTLGIQTLRNTILVAIFIGTITFQTAVTIILKYAVQTTDIDRVQVLITSVLLFLSFLCWASVIRCASHLGYQTGVISNNYDKISKHLVGKQNHDSEMGLLDDSDSNVNMIFENETHLMTVMLLSFR